MPIAMRCPGCKTAFEFENALEGKRIKCKSCGDIFRVEKPAKKSRDDDDVDDRPKPARRRDVDDDRPAPKSGRTRRPVDDDDDRPSPRKSRAIVDDDDEDEPRRRSRDDDDDDAPIKKKRSPLLIIAPLAALGVVLIVVVIIFLVRGKRKGGPGDLGDVAQASAKSCTLEIAGKEMNASILVVPDSGHNFGILRKTDQFKKSWVFEPYDIAAGRRTGRVDITNMDEPRSATMTPDGKYLMIVESAGFGQNESAISMWSIPDNRLINQVQRWNPYPRPAKGGLNAPSLYRAEFMGNDKIVTLSTSRIMDVWPLPNFDPKVIDGAPYQSVGDQLGHDDSFGQRANDKYQRQSAVSADRKTIAMWNGNGFTFASLLDGQETNRTTSAQALMKELWPRESFPDRFKGGPVAFSPDGKVLAGIVTHDWGGKKHALCLWNATEQTPPVPYEIAANQFNESPALFWWGNRYVVTHGAQTEGMLIDTKTGLAKRQLMGPSYGKYTFGRDGRLWYGGSDDPNEPAVMHVVDGIDPDRLSEPDDYEQNVELKGEYFLRRLWLEPTGTLRKPTRYAPPLNKRLIRRP